MNGDLNHAPIAPVRIVLTGFMGAGKTTVGRLLANELAWAFVDLDDTIVAREGRCIADIFATLGEVAFRELEHHALHEAIQKTHCVVALGGGAIELSANRELLYSSPGTHVVFLEAPLEILEVRCTEQQRKGAAIRPVFSEKSKLITRYTDRLPHYRMAHQTVVTVDHDPADVVRSILAGFDLSTKSSSHPS